MDLLILKTYYHKFLWYLSSKNITPNYITGARTIMFLGVIIIWGLARYYDLHNLLLFLVIVSVPIWLLDMVDGDLARVTNQMTDFGKWFDPFADKIKFYLAMAAMSFDLSYEQWFIVFILFLFDVLSTLLRKYQSSADTGANIFGKLKLVFQVIAIISLAFYIYFIQIKFKEVGLIMFYIGNISLFIATIFATISVLRRFDNI